MLNPWSLDEAIEYWRKRTKDFKENCSYQSASISEQHVDWLEELKELRAEARKSKDVRPLTPRELMDLDGEIVWVKFNWSDYEDQYMVVDAVNRVCGSLSPGKIFYFKADKEGSCSYWDIWAAYRNKPEDCDDREDH